MPLWLRGNFLLFGAVALALVVFVGTLVFIIARPGRQAATTPPRGVLQDFKVELGDRGAVDLQTQSVAITLKFSGLPDDAAREMTVKVLIDGVEAQVSAPGGAQEVQVSALLKDKVENIVKTNGVGAVMLIKGTCEYGGAAVPFDVSAIRLQVISKTEKELGLAFDNFPAPTPKPAPPRKPTPSPSPTPTPPSPTPATGSSTIYNRKPTKAPTPYATPRATPYPTPRSDKPPREMKF